MTRSVYHIILGMTLTFAVQRCEGNPAPARSVYLRTTAGLFCYGGKSHRWTIILFVTPVKSTPVGGALYLRACFQNPKVGQPSMVVESSTLAKPVGKLGIRLESPAVTGMQDRKAYQVIVSVYADKAHMRFLGVHRQAIEYHNIGDPEAALQNVRAQNRG